MTEQQVNRFLWDFFGYRKIEELMDGEKGGVPMDEFLKGTVFERFRKRSSSGGSTSMPLVPKIYSVDYDTARPSDFSTNEFCVGFKGNADNYFLSLSEDDLDLRLPYGISNRVFFDGLTPDEVAKYLSDVRDESLPKSKFDYKKFSLGRKVPTHFHASLRQNDFVFIVTGSLPRNHTRGIESVFSTDENTVERINGVVRRYYGMLGKGKKERLRVVENESDLEESSLVYDPQGSYRIGQEIEHSKFGNGRVTGYDSGVILVDFAGETRRLAHNLKR